MAFLIPDAGAPPKKKAGSGIAPGNVPASAFNMPTPEVMPPYGGGGSTGVQPSGPAAGGGTNGAGSAPAAAAAGAAVAPWESDPILLKIRGLGKSQKQNLATDLGDPDLAASVLNLDPNDPIIQAIKNNPNSALAKLARQHVQNVTGINEGRNKQGLFYGGHRIKDLADEETEYGGAKYTARSGFRDALLGVDRENMAGEESAYGRWLEHPPVTPAPDVSTSAAAASTSAPIVPPPPAGTPPLQNPALANIGGGGGPGPFAGLITPQVATGLINALAGAMQPPKGSKKPLLEL